MQNAQLRISDPDDRFDSPWPNRYEVRPVIINEKLGFEVLDTKNRESVVAAFVSRGEADLECAILTLAHLKALRAKKSIPRTR